MTVAARGTGVASADGRLLWADDAFSAAVGRPLDELFSVGLAGILGLEPQELLSWETSDGLVQLPGDGGGHPLRVTALAEGGGRPWAFVVEIEGALVEGAGEPHDPPAVFALHKAGKLVAMWGRSRQVLGLTPAAVGRRLPNLLKEDPLIGALIRRTLRGEPTTGLFVGNGSSRQVHLFPVQHPDEGTPGVVGVAYLASGLQPSPGVFRARVERDGALAELALMALRSAEAGPLLEAVARLVHRALDAESCAVSEYLPEGAGLHVRAAFGLEPSAPRVLPAPGIPPAVTVPATAGLEETRDGSLVVPIDGPPAFGRLVVQLPSWRSFTTDDKGFVLAAVEIVTAALVRLAADEQRRRAALHDPLTGLPLRTLILDQLNHAVARSRRQGSQVGLLFVDLDGFRMVNDTLGRSAGDELLVAVARRLVSSLRPSDTLGRLGGDEFMVVCEDLGGEADARVVAGRLAASFQEPFQLSGADVSVSASVGVSLAGAATDPAALRAEAGAAMRRAKLLDGSSVVLG
jgi:diguanylate cyclase (GGDEF)-like protein